MRWLYKLEYKFGRYYIRNLMTIMIAGMAIVYVADMLLQVSLTSLLSFNAAQIYAGQVWRVITFIFVPPGGNPMLTILSLYVYYAMGNLLENMWGGFKLNIYYLIGIIGAIAAGFISGAVLGPIFGFTSNYALNSSLMLAVACSMPETTFRLFFVLPIKAKWIAIAYFVFMVPDVINAFMFSVSYGLSTIIVLAFSLLNFFIFFGPGLIRSLKDWLRVRKNQRNWRNNWRS